MINQILADNESKLGRKSLLTITQAQQLYPQSCRQGSPDETLSHRFRESSPLASGRDRIASLGTEGTSSVPSGETSKQAISEGRQDFLEEGLTSSWDN